MNRNYEEIKSKMEKVMRESIDSFKNDINFFQQGLAKLENEKPTDPYSLLLKAIFEWFKTYLFVA